MSNQNDNGAFVWLALIAMLFLFAFLGAITFGSQTFKACKENHTKFYCLVNS